MIDLSRANEWQHIDPETGLVFPWYTKSFLDELVKWDLKDKVVLEIGMGASTLWWFEKCKFLFACDNNTDVFSAVWESLQYKRDFVKKTSFQWIIEEDHFVQCIQDYGAESDIIIIDCEPVEWRDKCAQSAISCLKPGGKLVIDNWLQPSVWMASEETQKLLSDYPCEVYKQEGHPDWQTAVFTKP